MNFSTRIIEFRPPRIAMLLMIIALAVNFLIPFSTLASSVTLAVGAGISGFSLMIRGWWLFQVRETAICPTADATTLVTNDVFALSRNPMYLGMIFMLSGMAIYLGTLPFYMAVIIYFVIINFAFCPYEEQKLQEAFGEDFLAYKRAVRRWL